MAGLDLLQGVALLGWERGNASYIREHFSLILWNKACLLSCNTPRRQRALANKALVSKSLPAELRIWAASEFCDIFTQLCPRLMELRGSFCESKCSVVLCRPRCHHKSSTGAAPFQALNQQKADWAITVRLIATSCQLPLAVIRGAVLLESSLIAVKSLDAV